MKSRCNVVTIIAGASFFAVPSALGCGGPGSTSGATSAETTVVTPAAAATPGHTEWARAMAKTPTTKAGCFKAAHPSTTWEEVPCVRAPSVPMAPARGGATGVPLQVGNGAGDFTATVPGNIDYAEGSFPIVSGLSSEGATGSGEAFSGYSLQLNTNTGNNNAMCNLGPNASGCTVWQQFVYLGSQLFIQYWLINYFATAAQSNALTCPDGFAPYDNGYYLGTTVDHQYDCYTSASSAASLPVYGASQLVGLRLSGSAGPAGNQVTLYDGVNQVATVSSPSQLSLSTWWESAEFNVFGPGVGSAAVFNFGTSMAVQTLTDSLTSPVSPSCVAGSFTGEINNLTVVPNSCCVVGGSPPGIFFTQSNAPGAAAYECQ